MRRVAGLLTGFAVVLAAAGCAETDPYMRPGLWQPTGANALNLAAMVERPSDLLRGRGTRGSPAFEALPPVGRIITGKLTPLPSSGSQEGPGGPAAPPPPVGGDR